ncbi:type II toxin-antitoxin system HicB family antitoxin [Capnocytophaga sp. ARDL2]|uniref:type II toxin-antitoxin system HicB family antitoxin n=1 Tax=Capnocytophaga sp. ARDL2 TaxID=3238809 RepID=UPI003556AA0C
MEIIIKIEASNDFLDAYAENLEGVTAGGETIQEVKTAILESIEIQKELGNIDDIAYELVYKYDTKSLLRYYGKIFTMPALERLTGINQKQLHHYIMGKSVPRDATKNKIELALHKLGNELIAIKL